MHGSTAVLADGRRLTLWLERPLAHSRLPLGNLLLFYVSITGLAVLVLTYIALTHLIVRPLDSLTRSSELLATGAPVHVPERGAAEVARLAAAFNEMASQLRAEREALEQRLHELERTTGELKRTQQQLIHGEKLASVGRLAAGVAHGIGNPLAAILGLVELLRAGGLSPEQAEEFLARVHGETERIDRIIRDLLDFSRRDPRDDLGRQRRPGAGRRRRGAARAPAEGIEAGRDRGRHRAGGRPCARPRAPLDAGRAQPAAQRRRRARRPRPRAHRSARATATGECTLTVSDDGPGLPPQVLAHLFEPFTTTKPPGKGTGLGLAVCHALVEGMGGTITAGNRLEGGARFEVNSSRIGFANPCGCVRGRIGTMRA